MLVQVFFLQKGDHTKGGASDSAERDRLTERIARAFCMAMCPHLKLLKEDGMAKLGLRVAFESQEVRKSVSCQLMSHNNTHLFLFTGRDFKHQMSCVCLQKKKVTT